MPVRIVRVCRPSKNVSASISLVANEQFLFATRVFISILVLLLLFRPREWVSLGLPGRFASHFKCFWRHDQMPRNGYRDCVQLCSNLFCGIRVSKISSLKRFDFFLKIFLHIFFANILLTKFAQSDHQSI